MRYAVFIEESGNGNSENKVEELPYETKKMKRGVIMVCVNHSGENGVNTCSMCGEWLCESCSVDINGRIVCKTCISKKIAGEPAAVVMETARPARYFSGFLLFLCSAMPGLNYMYLGLIKRGLFFMTAFFAFIFAAAITNLGELCVFLPVLWVTCFFDGFEKKRRLNSGAYVPDSVDDILNWLRKYKTPVIMACVLILALGSLNNMGRYVFHRAGAYMGYYGTLRPLLSLVVLGVGGYFIAKAVSAKKSRPAERPDEPGAYGND